ncbi:hypothetical protein F2Q70_00010389 [Brassica cretica]|uniref:Vacuolar iron transporter n=1 Tax=Brassica cretica TaxID=69181 RepID=A0A8S9LZU4_BRACR|nr:hypothetical protein F2Q70_00010389 [Brassica cretica]
MHLQATAELSRLSLLSETLPTTQIILTSCSSHTNFYSPQWQSNEEKKERLPNPGQAALASALAFSVGAAMPLLAAVFIENHKVRMAVVAIVATLALLVFGVTGAVLGKTSVLNSSVRVVIGGWIAMALTFGLTKFIGSEAMQI